MTEQKTWGGQRQGEEYEAEGESWGGEEVLGTRRRGIVVGHVDDAHWQFGGRNLFMWRLLLSSGERRNGHGGDEERRFVVKREGRRSWRAGVGSTRFKDIKQKLAQRKVETFPFFFFSSAYYEIQKFN